MTLLLMLIVYWYLLSADDVILKDVDRKTQKELLQYPRKWSNWRIVSIAKSKLPADYQQ